MSGRARTALVAALAVAAAGCPMEAVAPRGVCGEYCGEPGFDPGGSGVGPGSDTGGGPDFDRDAGFPQRDTGRPDTGRPDTGRPPDRDTGFEDPPDVFVEKRVPCRFTLDLSEFEEPAPAFVFDADGERQRWSRSARTIFEADLLEGQEYELQAGGGDVSVYGLVTLPILPRENSCNYGPLRMSMGERLARIPTRDAAEEIAALAAVVDAAQGRMAVFLDAAISLVTYDAAQPRSLALATVEVALGEQASGVFSPDGAFLLAAGSTGSAVVDVAAGAPATGAPAGRFDPATAQCGRSATDRCLVRYDDGRVVVLRLAAAGGAVAVLADVAGAVTAALADDGTALAAVDAAGDVTLVELRGPGDAPSRVVASGVDADADGVALRVGDLGHHVYVLSEQGVTIHPTHGDAEPIDVPGAREVAAVPHSPSALLVREDAGSIELVPFDGDEGVLRDAVAVQGGGLDADGTRAATGALVVRTTGAQARVEVFDAATAASRVAVAGEWEVLGRNDGTLVLSRGCPGDGCRLVTVDPATGERSAELDRIGVGPEADRWPGPVGRSTGGVMEFLVEAADGTSRRVVHDPDPRVHPLHGSPAGLGAPCVLYTRVAYPLPNLTQRAAHCVY